MKPDSPDAPPDRPTSTKPAAPTGNETQVIDLAEVELLVAQHSAESQRQLDAASPSERPLPPPLPPSALPPSLPSLAPAEVAARGNVFYVVAILAFLVIGIGGGLVIAKTLSAPAPARPEPTHAPAAAAASSAPVNGGAAVITIPTVEMNDADSGTK